jgi:hypothetical protein
MKNIAFLILKILFISTIILPKSNAESSIKVTKFNNALKDCYESVYIPPKANSKFDLDISKTQKLKACNDINREVVMGSIPSFIIAGNIMLNQSWSSIRSNKKCIANKERSYGSSYSYFHCDISPESKAVYSFKYYESLTTIGLHNITYSTCSHSDWKMIKDSLISKFGSNSDIDSPISRYQRNPELLRISNKVTGETLEASLVRGPDKKLQCPGDVRLIIKIRLNDLNQKVKHVEGGGFKVGQPLKRSTNEPIEEPPPEPLYYTYSEDPYERLLTLHINSENIENSKINSPKF